MRTLNSIAVEYLLRTDSQKNNNQSEEQTIDTIELNPEHYIKDQKSLLFHLYDLEEEDLYN
ncbi:MAG: hypothetical protein EOO44_16810 [Flavobacterium sp.]|nr:MAG: hypothetical protein EOO44_16810 [Flavobacterium sp.]